MIAESRRQTWRRTIAIAADRLALDLSALPWHAERFSAGFYLGRGHNRKPLLLVAPGLGNAVVPHIRYAASLVLTLAGGLVAKDLGQVLVTGDQIIVMESLAHSNNTLISHIINLRIFI